MKDKWRHYAAKARLVQKGYIEQHQNRNCPRKTPEASRRDSIKCCRQIEQEKEIERLEDERLRKEESDQTHQQRRQGIPCPDQRRSEIEENVKTEEKVIVSSYMGGETNCILREPVNESVQTKKKTRKSKSKIMDSI